MSEKNKQQSRRDFLKAGGLAAAGIVLTPIAVACGGGEEEGTSKPRKKKKKVAKSKGGDNGGGNKPAPEANSDMKLVDSVSNGGTVVLSALAGAAWTKKLLTIDASQAEVAEAWKTRGGTPYDESNGYTNVAAVGGKHVVANVLFRLTPKKADTPMLKYSADAEGLNQDFRFTRVLVCGADKKVTYKVYDNTNHNITIETDGNEVLNESKTSDKGDPITSEEIEAGDYTVRCSMHKWEAGFIYAMEHAAFGVTGCDLDHSAIKDHGKARTNDGKVTISNVAAGDYTVEVVYEGSVKGTMDITVEAGKTVTKDYAWS